MPRSAGTSAQTTFTKGLITEATGLNFPEDAATETFNCIFDDKGIVGRRLGIDREPGYGEVTLTPTGLAYNSYYWRAAAGNGDNGIVVVQRGPTLYFYLQDDAVSSQLIDTIDLTTFKPSGAPAPDAVECDFASGNGFLFVCHPNLESFYCEYDGASSVTGTAIQLLIRDFTGVDDTLEVDERPAVLSLEHEYNLKNQGWDTSDVDGAGTGLVHVLNRWDAVRTDFPSNADVWWLSKQADGQYNPQYRAPTLGNSPAPQGHYILDVYEEDRTGESGVSSIPIISSDDERASTLAFFAGRVWYAGIKGQNYSNKIYFSQIVDKADNVGNCYQNNDPTSEDISDLLANDGGVIVIPEAGTIVKLFALEDSMIVFTTNGVWRITGSEGIGFKANDYSVTIVSATEAISRSSFVNAGGIPLWWNNQGIFAIVSTQGALQAQSLTDKTIKTFYEAIPQDNLKYVHGTFNKQTRVVQWTYRSTTAASLTESYQADSVLNLNLVSNAFYPWTIDVTDVSIVGVCFISAPAAYTKFLVYYPTSKHTFAHEFDTDYVDWDTISEKAFDSYFVSGYQVHGAAQRKFQPTYIYLFTETANAKNTFDFSSQWNFSTSGDTGRWSSVQRVQLRNADYAYRFKRLKTRGHGLALQFRIQSVSGEPFRLIGWSAFETQNSNI